MKNLVELRNQTGMSQRKLAKRAKVGHITIARIETGVHDPSLSTLRRLAKALQVKVVDLIDE